MKKSESAQVIQCSSKRTARTHWGCISFNQQRTKFFLMGAFSPDSERVMGCQAVVCVEIFPTEKERNQILNSWRDGKANSAVVKFLYPKLARRN